MKHLLTLVGMTAMLVGSASAQLASRPEATSKAAKARQDARVARALAAGQAVYYIGTYAPVGSHIPQVCVRTKDFMYTINGSGHGSAYGTAHDGLGGSSTIGGALFAADPAISVH